MFCVQTVIIKERRNNDDEAQEAVFKFANGFTRMLGIAEYALRGIEDGNCAPVVINFDLPKTATSYIYRAAHIKGHFVKESVRFFMFFVSLAP